jgi:hypothetical protein
VGYFNRIKALVLSKKMKSKNYVQKQKHKKPLNATELHLHSMQLNLKVKYETPS